MQNRYVGDVGDFGKYGLLRGIFQKPPEYKLGIVWYLVPDGYGDSKSATNDGKHIAYLEDCNKPRFRGCDEDLYDYLKSIVSDKMIPATCRRLLISQEWHYYR